MLLCSYQLYYCIYYVVQLMRMQLSICSAFSTYVSLDGDGCSLTPLGLHLQLPCMLQLSERQKGGELICLRNKKKQHNN